MLLRTKVNRTSAMPTLWHLWVIAITALYGFHLGLSHRIPALRKAQTPPHGYSLLGFGSLTWALPYQSIRSVMKTLLVVHGSFLLHFLWHTQVATRGLNLHPSDYRPHVDDKLCPNSRRSICYVHYYSLSHYKAWRKACWKWSIFQWTKKSAWKVTRDRKVLSIKLVCTKNSIWGT